MQHRIRPLPILPLIALGLPASAAGQRPVLWDSLPPGRYDAGFRRIWRLDDSRVWQRSPSLATATGPIARPIRVDVWYPARCGGRRPASFGSYVAPPAPSEGFKDMTGLLGAYDLQSYRNLAGDPSAYDALMAVATGVCMDAPPAGGRHPLVLYSAGWYSRSPDNTVLAEFLASHGYVVATVPQLNPGLWTSNFRSTPAAVETQVRDVEFAFGVVLQEPEVDRTRVATMGYSKGGDVALVLQGRNPLIRAVVGLDPSFALGSGEDLVSSPYFGIDRNRVPILVIRRPGGEDALHLPRALDSLALAQRLLVEVPGADHGTFGDDPALLAYLRAGASAGVTAHTTVARVVLAFLDTVLGPGSPRVTPAGLDAWVGNRAQALFQDAAPVPDTDGWEHVLQTRGLAAAVHHATDLGRQFPTLTIVEERSINALGYRRLREGHAAQAVDLFRLNAQTHPTSANAFDSLADGCVALGDDTCVVAAYRDLLRTLPSDTSLPSEVKDRMRERAQKALQDGGL